MGSGVCRVYRLDTGYRVQGFIAFMGSGVYRVYRVDYVFVGLLGFIGLLKLNWLKGFRAFIEFTARGLGRHREGQMQHVVVVVGLLIF